ncbi:hypothetical protein RclHR1_01190003 [Rhizophagus clarus]|uniref:Protein kinase domain-containing protein n=1 Tax=Rhizophagus clarus TaxID=94130 RepID=A0A2Z6Q5J7_9GLOM|nr:hypothetical protein RclHR1_01190003 [Rhizophagus clarus]
MQLKINHPNDIVFEWIYYNQFNDIKVISKNDLYVATWVNGPLCYDSSEDKYVRKSKRVALKRLENSQNVTRFLFNLKKYLAFKIRGISQDPNTNSYMIVFGDECFEKCCAECGATYTNMQYKWCKPCQINNLKNNFVNWTSKDKTIDNFIQETQLKVDYPTDIIFEWIPYDRFVHIRKRGRNNLAIWKNGPLSFFWKWIRKFDETVALIYLDNPKEINEFLDEVKKYLTLKINIYGISQDPYTRDYIVVIKCSEECCVKYSEMYSQHIWCKQCQINYLRRNFKSWTKNEKINNFIQEIQLEIKQPTDSVFEWIPYDQFNNFKKIDEDNFSAVYSANWKDGPLIWNLAKYTRDSNKAITLILMYKLIKVDDFLIKVKKYMNRNIYFGICGISQNPYTEDYIIICTNFNHFTKYCWKCAEIYASITYKWCKSCQKNFLKENFNNWTSGDEKIDNFIQEMQLKINHPTDVVYEWIPYNQFCYVEDIGKDDFAIVHSATWKDGPLHWNSIKYTRDPDKKVTLIYINNSQNIADDFLIKVKKYMNRNIYFGICGISQNPYTEDYIIVCTNFDHFTKCCLKCAEIYTSTIYEWCKSCQISFLKESFNNWTSGDEKIDNFIQEMQLKINHPTDVVYEWIPYKQFYCVEEIGKDNFATVHSATWKDGPLHWNSIKYTRDPDKKVTLIYINNSQNIADDFLIKVKIYMNRNKYFGICGISQNPYTEDYIIICTNYNHFTKYCLKCAEIYTSTTYKWCKSCQMSSLKENFNNWTSGDEKIDNFIQEMQLKINHPTDVVYEWILYNKFNDIEVISGDNFATIYLATLKNGILSYDLTKNEYIRKTEKVTLKYLVNTQNTIYKFLNSKIKDCCTNGYNDFKIYGLSQAPNTKDYIIVYNYEYYKNYYSEQSCLKCENLYSYIQYKWCKPCIISFLKENFTNYICNDEKILNLIQEMQSKIVYPTDMIFEWIPYNQFNNIKTIYTGHLYLATWKDGPLFYDSNKYIRKSKRVVIKCLNDSQNINEILNNEEVKIYGISRNIHTKNYIIVFDIEYFESYTQKYCVKCDEIYTYIQHMWCKPCEMSCLRDTISIKFGENEKIDKFVYEMQLRIKYPFDIVFEWIPYDQFNDIKEISKGNFTTICLAIWKNGPLYWKKMQYTRNLNKKVILKHIHNSQNTINGFLDEMKYITSNDVFKIYGISQNPYTKNYIIVLDNNLEKYCVKCNKMYSDVQYKWCRTCKINFLIEDFINWTSGNETIDNFIQEMQLKISYYNDIILEWVAYNQLYNIKEISKDYFSTICSGMWKDKAILVKYLHNSQNSVNEFLNEVKAYSIYLDSNKPKIYGISQNPNTKNYIMILHSKSLEYCVKCNKMYTFTEYEWCKVCQTNYLKDNLAKWTSKNEKIDNFIQEMQLKINHPNDIVFEWIPYNGFNNIKEIGKGGFATVYSGIWKDGPLYYNQNEKQYTRNPNKIVALKFLFNLQNSVSDDFLNEVREYSIIKKSNILNIYGISQDPNTNNYIIVLDYAEGGNFDNWMNKNYKNFYWLRKLNILLNIINGLKEIHQREMVHCDFHTGNILFLRNDIGDLGNDILISDMGLCGKVGNIDNISETKIYGVMPYISPEVLRGKPYSQAADIYSFGMIMYFAATEKQPFANRAHDKLLALDICNGIRPKINEPEAPKCYIDLMKKCWDSNPNNRPNAIEIEELIRSFYSSCNPILGRRNHFKAAEEYRKLHLNSFEKNKQTTHSQAIYTSRLLNPIIKDISKNHSDCFDCAI